MALTGGMRLGPYEILGAAGAGGMGEVYKARDTRLERTVAVKVLPAHLHDSPDLRQRFEREARVVSSLSHPNICALFDVGQQDGVDFLVMEYLEGETLSDRLARGPMPPAQALKAAIEVAEALDRAHRQGIVHRDLKPGNIMLTKAGAKLMDFGLAKPASSALAVGVATDTPTAAITNKPLTAEGTIVGTFQYMSPEQLEGKEADARSDIFSFGAILYEMLTGKRAFEGKTQISVVAAILDKEPEPVSAVQPLAPAALDDVVKTALAKDPEERWQTAHDLKIQLKWIFEGRTSQVGVAPPAAGRKRRRLLWAAGAAVLAVAFAAAAYYTGGARRQEPMLRSSILLPGGESMGQEGEAQISPDERWLVFTGVDEHGTSRLWLREISSGKTRLIDGTRGANYPFWSPDSSQIGFFADGKLKKLDLANGVTQIVCDAPNGRGGAWAPDGTIVFSPSYVGGLQTVSGAGGTPAELTKTATGQATHRSPAMLPDGEHVMFFSGSDGTNPNGLYVTALKPAGAPQLLLRGESAGQVAGGYLLFVRRSILMAQRFDARHLRVEGEAIPLVPQVRYNIDRWRSDLSATGRFLLTSEQPRVPSQLTWYSLEGAKLGSVGAPLPAPVMLQISPDGKQVVAEVPSEDGDHIWLFDTAGGTGTPFTTGPGTERYGTWSPDGKQIAFIRDVGGLYGTLVKSTGADGKESVLVEGDGYVSPGGWSPDGRYFVFIKQGPTTHGVDIWAKPLFGDRKSFPIVQTPADDVLPQISPDGKWLAYVSSQSGVPLLYLTPFPGPGPATPITTAPALGYIWHPGGKEILVVTSDQKLAGIDLSFSGGEVKAGAPHALFGGNKIYPFDISRDGKRLLVAVPTRQESTQAFTLIDNWTEGMKK
jgi:Tol biopolymer transport system component/tRNA A-37 threonylcarbamoyl transferase component Bud32